MIPRIYALILKEFLALFLDKSSRMAIIVPPVIQLFVFGYAATFDLNRVRLAILNEDSGAISRELIGRFQGNPTFDIVGYLQSERSIAALIDNESTLKTFIQVKGRPCLCAENPRYPKLHPAAELVIQGVVIAVLRRLR